MRPLRTPFSTRMEEILAELRALREIVAGLQEREEVNKPVGCMGVTGKGTRCRNKAHEGGYCRMHRERVDRPPKSEVPKKKEKRVKVKKIQPEHNHGVGEVGIDCQLCATHGDVWDPKLTECVFIGPEIHEI